MPFSLRQFNADDKFCQAINLDVFSELYPPETVTQVLTQCHANEQRARKLTMSAMVYYVIALSLYPRLSLAGVFRQLVRALRFLWPDPSLVLPGKGALSTRRTQLGPTPLRRLFRRVCHPLATRQTKGAFWRGFRLMAIDGTLQDVADTPANTNFFGRITSGKNSSPFPQMRCLYLAECATHAIVDALLGPCRVSEHRLAWPLLRSIQAGMLVLLDRGLFSGALLHGLCKQRAHGLSRLESHVLTKPYRRLHDGSYLAWLFPTSGPTRLPLLLRVIPYRIADPQVPGSWQQGRLVTTLLNPKTAPAHELLQLYHERWEVELTIDEQKTHQRLANLPLRSRTPAGVLQEMYGLLLAHYAIRFLMHQAALQADLDPDRLSFTVALQALDTAIYEFALLAPCDHATLKQRLLAALRVDLLPPRRLRFQARVVKRPLSAFRRKRPWHVPGIELKGVHVHDLLLI